MSGRGGGEQGDTAERRVVFNPSELFQALSEAEIDYVLVGGLAVAAHGYVRATQDLDLCPGANEENLKRLAALLEELGAVNRDADDFAPDELVAHDLEGLRLGGNFRLFTALGPLDVMQYLRPFEAGSWKELSRKAESRLVFGQSIRVCSYDDLLAMKTAAGREQDETDIKNLKAARREAGL
ncbi:MAG: hypothetical protein WKF62_06790 [Solirubrobacterales bacterium]